ncbi:N-acetyltransferase family protein [Roseobacter sp. N2S]|uniref:GNAT family N-acetyltransferase n=1 Tax=Roseobacter sp. N2S TaxID=2663844 RepID=UPI00285D3E6E|nr:N-acetyltransferase family protein [Roseobacter sp. N2S]MDR6265268.1 phosphinothricin acetyltransferase [Roseobacter sp. N2S]
MNIRPATPADAAQICAIWNPIIRDTVITFTTLEKSRDMIVQMLETHRENGWPFLVAVLDQTILGFACYGPFRSGPGYAQTMEHSINLAPQARGHGTGTTLMQALETHAKTAQVHSLIAGVSAANPAAITFHIKRGFTRIATLPQVGRKFDQWLDLVLLQKLL